MSARVGVTADLLDAAGRPSFGDAPLRLLDEAGIPWEWLPPLSRIGPEQTARYEALYINTPPVGADSFGPAVRTRVIARHGVGFDSVDVAACSANGVLVTIQPDGVRRPVAVAALTLVLALSQRLVLKDRLIREGRWAERVDHMGGGLVGRTLGVVGAGSIGRELLALARPFGFRLLAADPLVDPSLLDPLGTTLTSLDDLLATSDYVVVLAPLNSQTRGLIGAAQLARMQPHAMLVNVARGPVMDEAALIDALARGAIAGAGLDVFEQEPIDPANPLLSMPHVILTPHSLSWTDECFAGIATSGIRSIVDALSGRLPPNAIDPAAWPANRLP